jgi:hypothetical protein
MAIKYIYIFQSEALKIFPKLAFFVWKYKPYGNPDVHSKFDIPKVYKNVLVLFLWKLQVLWISKNRYQDGSEEVPSVESSQGNEQQVEAVEHVFPEIFEKIF